MTYERLCEEAGLAYVRASVRDSRGPERVEVGEVDKSFKRRPVGFTADLSVSEPLIWEGDDA